MLFKIPKPKYGTNCVQNLYGDACKILAQKEFCFLQVLQLDACGGLQDLQVSCTVHVHFLACHLHYMQIVFVSTRLPYVTLMNTE